LTLSDEYGAYELIIDHGKEIKYGGSVGSVGSGVDQIVEAVGGGELEIVQRRSF
jgi:hypothetical protein